MDECISWAVTAVALYGTWLNANNDRNGFFFWLFSNFFFFVISLKNGHFAMAFLFMAYFVLAIKGLKTWK